MMPQMKLEIATSANSPDTLFLVYVFFAKDRRMQKFINWFHFFKLFVLHLLDKLTFVFVVFMTSFTVLKLCHEQRSKFKNDYRAITPKLEKGILQFFCTSHVTSEIYLPTKSYVDTFL
jgi:hypothetical protein